MKMPDFGSMRLASNRRCRDAWILAHYHNALTAGKTWAETAREWDCSCDVLRNAAARLGLPNLRGTYGGGRKDTAAALTRAEARLHRRHRREWL